MKTLNKYINESSDNVKNFIEFIELNGEEGELKSCNKSYYDYYDECNPFDNAKFRLNVSNTVYADEYCDAHELDSILDDAEGFSEYIKNILDDQLTFDFDRGLIKCERVLDIQKSDFSEYKNNMGIYWSFVEGFGDAHGSFSFTRNNITIYALVDPKDVDWAETIAANMIDPDEYEITLNEDAPIQITKIIETKSKKTLLEKNILYYA